MWHQRHSMETLPTQDPTSRLVDHMDDGVLTTMWDWMRYLTWQIRLIKTLLVFVLWNFHLWWIQMEIRNTYSLELCLTCLVFQPKEYSPPIRSVPPVTSMTTSHINLEENNVWWPQMAGRVAYLSVTGWPTYLSDAQPMKRCSHIPRWISLQLESEIPRI